MAKQALDPSKALRYLEAEHQSLKEQVTVLDRRAFLTPEERRTAADLKKRKLRTKDRISALRLELSP